MVGCFAFGLRCTKNIALLSTFFLPGITPTFLHQLPSGRGLDSQILSPSRSVLSLQDGALDAPDYISMYMYEYNIYLSIYLSIDLSIHPSIHPSIYLFVYLSIYLSTYLFIYLSIYLSIYYNKFFTGISLTCFCWSSWLLHRALWTRLVAATPAALLM